MASRRNRKGMTAADFKRIALSLEGAAEGSHMGAVDFRVDGRIFATLASEAQGYGNLALTPAEQEAFVEELPEFLVRVAGGWGRRGMTHIVLGKASEDVFNGPLQSAGRLGVKKNARKKKSRGRVQKLLARD